MVFLYYLTFNLYNHILKLHKLGEPIVTPILREEWGFALLQLQYLIMFQSIIYFFCRQNTVNEIISLLSKYHMTVTNPYLFYSNPTAYVADHRYLGNWDSETDVLPINKGLIKRYFTKLCNVLF